MDDGWNRHRDLPAERGSPVSRDPCVVATTRLLALAGMGPALVYGTVAGGASGAVIGVLLLLLIVGAVAWLRQRRRRRPHQQDVAATEPPHVEDVFAQLVRAPCDRCGAPTLLVTCLDCTDPSPRRGRHRADGTPTDGSEGPGS